MQKFVDSGQSTRIPESTHVTILSMNFTISKSHHLVFYSFSAFIYLFILENVPNHKTKVKIKSKRPIDVF